MCLQTAQWPVAGSLSGLRKEAKRRGAGSAPGALPVLEGGLPFAYLCSAGFQALSQCSNSGCKPISKGSENQGPGGPPTVPAVWGRGVPSRPSGCRLGPGLVWPDLGRPGFGDVPEMKGRRKHSGVEGLGAQPQDRGSQGPERSHLRPHRRTPKSRTSRSHGQGLQDWRKVVKEVATRRSLSCPLLSV